MPDPPARETRRRPRSRPASPLGPTRLVALAVALLAAALTILAVTIGCSRTPTPVAEQPAPPASATATASAQATASAPETPAAAASSTAAQTGVVEIGWVGDTTPGSRYGSPPGNGRALFEEVRDRLRAPDLMAGNLEGTFGDGGKSKSDGDKSDSYSFQAPPKNAQALAWAGFDVMSLANNHTYDYFEKGLSATREALDDNEIAYTGLPGQITVREANGVRVAFVGFSPYRWNAGIADIEGAAKLVRKAKGEADVVVVLFHAGAEGADKIHTPQGAEKAYGEFRGDSRAFAHAMVDAGASLVLGSGPHVIRGIERYDGKLIAYSLGNFAGWSNFKQGGNLSLSGLLTVRVDKKGTVLGGRWLSLRIADPGVPETDSKHTSAKLVNELSQRDFEDTFELDSKGRFGAGE